MPKPRPFMRRKISSSSVSRLMETAVEAGVLQAPRLLGKKVGVGGHRQVLNTVNTGEQGHQHLHLVPDQRLPTGQTHLYGAQPDENPGQPGDLLECEQVGPWKEPVPLAVDLRGHAVCAPEIAPVRDRDPEVSEGPSHCVGNQVLYASNLRSVAGPSTASNSLFNMSF